MAFTPDFLFLAEFDRVDFVVLRPNDLAKLRPARLLPRIRSVFLLWASPDLRGKLFARPSASVLKSCIVLRKLDEELLLALHLVIGRDLLGVELLVAGVEEVAQHAVELLAVVDLVVVHPGGIVVDVPAECVFAAKMI